MLQRRHEPTGADRKLRDGRLERFDIKTVGRMHGDFNDVKSQALRGLQAPVKCRRFDRDGVAGAGYALQSEVKRFKCPCGDDDLVDPDRHSETQIPLRDLASKIDAAGRKAFDRGPGVQGPWATAQASSQFWPGKLHRTWKSRSERHHFPISRRLQRFENQIANREARRTCLRPRGSGRHRLSLKFTNVITRTGTCLDETVCLECLIGLQYGGRADLARLGQCANRGQLIACRQRSVADHAADFLRYRPVKLHTQHNTAGVDPPLVPASMQDMWRDPSEMITEQYGHE